MTVDVDQFRSDCNFFNENAPLPSKDENIPPRTLTRPFKIIVADCATLTNGKNVHIIGDRYTGRVWAYDLRCGGDAEEIIKSLEHFYRVEDKPTVITSDNAANFKNQAINNWATRHNISLEYSGG